MTGIGERLRAARERQGFDRAAAAERLHVDEAILESLEIEAFSSLGGLVYVRGHLRHYCELLGEPADELEQLLPRDLGGGYSAVTHQIKLPAQARPGAERRGAIGWMILAAIAAVAAGWYLFRILK